MDRGPDGCRVGPGRWSLDVSRHDPVWDLRVLSWSGAGLGAVVHLGPVSRGGPEGWTERQSVLTPVGGRLVTSPSSSPVGPRRGALDPGWVQGDIPTSHLRVPPLRPGRGRRVVGHGSDSSS